MSDSLFDIYQNVESSKELCDSLEAKYMAEDASSKKFLVSNFTNYKMTDSRPVMKQYNELLGILGRFTQHKINMDKAIQVSCIDDKLSPSLKDFKHTLKHLKKELTLVELGSHLRIEESFRVQDSDKPKGNNVAGPSVINMIEHNNSTRYNDNKGKRKHHDNTRADPNKKAKPTCTKGSVDGSSNSLKGSAFMSTSKLNDSILWYARLGHIHFKRMQDMSKYGLIPAFDMDTEKCIECIFVGYAEHSKAFRFFVIEPIESISINSIIESRDAIFDENRFSSVPRPSLMILNGTEDIGGSVVPEEVTEEVVQRPEPELRKSKRNKTPKKFGPEFQLYLIEGTKDEVSNQQSYCFIVEDDPKTFDEEMKSHDVAFWKEAINDEMGSIMGNNTWVLDDLPPSCKPLSYKWVFKKNKSTIRLLIAMASIHNLIIHQMDIKTASLNGELVEERAPKEWHQKFDEVVLPNGYLLNQADKCVYIKFNKSGKGAIICLYVNDMLIFGTNQVQVDMTNEFLSSRFSMKDIGEADVIISIRIKHESNGIIISQSHYIEMVPKKFNYFDCTPISTPIDTCEKLMPNNGQVVSQLEYSRVIGCLMYAMTCTRPDITFIVGKLSRLTYIGYPLVLEGYTDASWISNTKDNSTTSGWVFLLGGGAISWASKKQTCITGSTLEFKFMALATTSKEAEWLKNLLREIPLWSKPITPISIRCDSAATLAKAYSQMYNGKSRHLGVRHSMICKLITNRVVSIEFVRS
ncbi:zinc finger, CCHC-type containing protein [Tanacetum coccineum]